MKVDGSMIARKARAKQQQSNLVVQSLAKNL